jgi:uncharacterized membrane protein YhiD involved in acid resistance|tara:strand:+ start:1786 stop:2121 length:336 start_codon:yes stop_codon:yes gene_type:complete
MQGIKIFIIWLSGFIAIMLTAFLFNVSLGVLLITVVIFVLMKPILSAIHSKSPMDTFVSTTVGEIEAVPEIIEHVEEKIHEEVEIVKEKSLTLWSHHHQEVESIANELSSI